MKYIITALLLFSFALPTLANTTNNQSLNTLINEVLTEQSLSQNTQINCDEINSTKLEEIGDLVMSLRHPDQDEHEAMDQMMGGEGSESLKQLHIEMARGYLGCGTNIKDFTMPDNNYFSGMHMWNMWGLNNNYSYSNVVTTLLLWIILILVIIILIKYLTKKK